MDNTEFAQMLRDSILSTPPGNNIELCAGNYPFAARVKIEFQSGWKIQCTLMQNVDVCITKGQDDDLKSLVIEFFDNKGISAV